MDGAFIETRQKSIPELLRSVDIDSDYFFSECAAAGGLGVVVTASEFESFLTIYEPQDYLSGNIEELTDKPTPVF